MLADIAGYCALAVEVAIAAMLMSVDGSAYLMAGFIYLVLALAARHFWHRKDAPVTPRQWLFSAGGVPLMGGVVFLIDGVLGQLSHPDLGFVDGALHTGPFGGALTAIATVGMGAITVAGLVRSFFVSRSANLDTDESRSD